MMMKHTHTHTHTHTHRETERERMVSIMNGIKKHATYFRIQCSETHTSS
jgi:hypothetical protein